MEFLDYIIIYLFVLITGACIGSFLNVVALRALSNESIVFPASKCPKCDTPIKWYDNIPVLSYLFTFKGKCRSCGEKVSIQYPIVEAITAVLFLVVFLFFGISLKTLMLLILLCISIVITITDLKKEYVFDSHSWALIIVSIVYSAITHDITFAFIGLLGGAVIMEAIARLSYYLVRKKSQEEAEKQETTSEEKEEQKENEEDININDYVEKYKRAFGEGDTYLAAAAGALLGIKYFIAAIACAIIVQAACILPQFMKKLLEQGQKRLFISLVGFITLALVYFIVSNLITINLFIVYGFIALLLFFAIDSITRLKKATVDSEGFTAIPFGPALLFATFIMLFFGSPIVSIIKKHIFMIFG